ncbi:hypothetical protein QWY93_05105 [Echinicola jeungdonensis]|uniref:Por secretion system C-terminal sorting domain-containing protein n=1 Tax=Echinicola jeungdonensis TaxID=709343 RepID=A0ABV5J5B0_9BACT|nr:hypothetical protein [Echinicola jeungdonensis]MDN3668702.1 hypothetical protein [Echinicola jeungdonensis]
MKTLFTSALLLLGLVIIVAANPVEKNLKSFTTVETSHKHVYVHFSDAVGKVFVSIYDNKNNLVVKGNYEIKEPTIIPYNLSELRHGNYRVRVKKGGEEAIYRVTTKSVESTKLPMVAYGKVKDRYTINIMVLGIEEPGTQVDIFDNDNCRIGSDWVNVSEGFTRDYHFKHIEARDIYFRIKDSQGRTKYLYF